MYHGNLKEAQFPSNVGDNKLPIRAFVVFDKTLEESFFRFDNVFWHWGHGVVIQAKLGLKAAIRSSFEAIFQEVSIADKINLQHLANYDVIIIPRIEMVGHVIEVSAIVKSALTEDVLQTYRRRGNMNLTVPTSVHIIGFINVIPFSFLTTPIATPLITEIIGKQAEKDLANTLRYLLASINDDIMNDRQLLMKLNLINK
jgi:hypothetical protein